MAATDLNNNTNLNAANDNLEDTLELDNNATTQEKVDINDIDEDTVSNNDETTINNDSHPSSNANPNNTTYHFGYWAFGRDMKNLNLSDLANHGVTDILINYYVCELYNQSEIESWISKADQYGIHIHIWTQIFWFDGEWHKPIENGVVNQEYFNQKIEELEGYARIKGLSGIHYDYMRFAGPAEYSDDGIADLAIDNPGGVQAISSFVKQATSAIKAINPNLTVSSAICPPVEHIEDWFGCNYTALTSTVDAVIPMLYTGIFYENHAWIYESAKWFVNNSKGADVWIGLLSYVRDNFTELIPIAEMNMQIKTVLDANATGALLYRVDISENIDFNNLTVDENELKSFKFLNYQIHSSLKELNLSYDYVFNETFDSHLTNGINIFEPITINGNGHVIDAEGMARIFNITANNVILNNIAFTNVNKNKGSVIYNESNVKFIDCIFINDVVKYYNGTERFVVYINESNVDGLTVKITINGVTYEKTIENSQASLALNLAAGNYTVKVDFDGISEFKSKTLYSNVEILPTIQAKDVLKVFRNETQYNALFTDRDGNPLVNTNVTFNINGVLYTRTTNSTGWAKLNINLQHGEYVLTAYNPKTNERLSNNVTILSLIESNDLNKYFRNDSQFVVRIRGADGNWAKSGETVTFNINGVLYNRTTNATGHATLNINLNPNTYIITTFYKDCADGNTIKVLPKLLVSDLEMKYNSGSEFIAKTLDDKGSTAPNQNVSFNINGIIYNCISDNNGEAKLKISLIPGKYIITSDYCSEIHSNTILISE